MRVEPKNGRYLLSIVIACLIHPPLIHIYLLQLSDDGRGLQFSASGQTIRGKITPIRKEKKEDVKGQIVDVAKPQKREVPPEQTRYLSRWDRRVEKEQKARRIGQASVDGANGIAPKEKSNVQSPQSNSIAETNLKESDMQAPSVDPKNLIDRGNRTPKNTLKGLESLYLPSKKGTPNFENIQAMMAGMSDDALIDIKEEGEATMLNTRSFKYWDFFQRVKERVRQEWEPGEVYRKRDPYGKVYGQQDRLTILHVVLDDKGNVVRLEVVKESGLPFLDQEAIRAFREAAPFPNPPKGLQDEKGKIAFNFGFLLEINSSKYRFFWQR